MNAINLHVFGTPCTTGQILEQAIINDWISALSSSKYTSNPKNLTNTHKRLLGVDNKIIFSHFKVCLHLMWEKYIQLLQYTVFCGASQFKYILMTRN